jgi:ribulose-phosphate 3-epimerase
VSDSREVKIAVSVLAADFARLGEQVREAVRAGVDWIHVDVMDGHFVPNLSIGPPVIKALRPVTKLPFDVHLMIEKPELSIPDYVNAGADRLTVHVETCPHLHRTIQQIGSLGAKTGVTLNPGTPLETLEPVLAEVDLVLIMSVNPGFGGQSYIPKSTERVARVREMLDAAGSPAELQADGGINQETAREVAQAGATVLVVGSGIYGGRGSVAQNVAKLREAIA